MNSNIMLRHRVVKLIRRYLEDVYGFVEVISLIFSLSEFLRATLKLIYQSFLFIILVLILTF